METTGESNIETGGKGVKSMPSMIHKFEDEGSFFRHFSPGLKLVALNPESFTKASGEERLQIQAQMDFLLARPRTREEMFPDSQLTYSLGREYWQVYSDEISSLFPLADDDLRALLQRFSHLFRTGYAWKILFKRIVIAFIFASFFLVAKISDLLLTPYLSGLPPSLIVALVYTASFILVLPAFYFASGVLDERFTRALQASCTVVSQNTLERLSALAGALDNIKIAIRDLYDQSEEAWVKETNYLMALMLWLPIRVLHIEGYFQLIMWRVRREFAIVQYLAIVLQLVVVALALLIAFLVLDPAWFAGGEFGRYIFATGVLLMGVVSFLGGSTSVQFIKQNIPIDQWATFGVIRGDVAIAGVVGFLIKKFIMLRDVGRSK